MYGNDALWVVIPTDGTVRPGGDSSRGIKAKFPTVRLRPGTLSATAARLDGAAPPAEVHIPDGYYTSFQAFGVTFPTPGCWQITERVADSELQFVVRVIGR